MVLNQTIQPKIITIKRRHNQGFGFTLRHFIAYPPEPWTETLNSYQRKAMETIFIKEIHSNGPAYGAGLKTGDRILMVNNISVAGISYSAIVSMIKQTPTVLKLQVVPKECDILQMYYTDIAHNPETNRSTIDIDRPLMPITSSTNITYNNLHSRLISYSPEGFANSTTIHQPNLNLQKSIYSFGSNEYFLKDSRLKQQNLSVLRKPNNDEFLVRLRKSIDQKEEFLRPPTANCSKTDFHQQEPEKSSISRVKTSNMNKASVTFLNNVDNLVRSENETFPLELKTYRNIFSSNNFNNISEDFICNSNIFCADAQSVCCREDYSAPKKSIQVCSINSPINSINTIDNDTNFNSLLNNSASINISAKNANELANFGHISHNNYFVTNVKMEPGKPVKDKFQKKSEFSETLSETGVTNKVFERKIITNFSRSDVCKKFSLNIGKVHINDGSTEQKTVPNVKETAPKKETLLPDRQNCNLTESKRERFDDLDNKFDVSKQFLEHEPEIDILTNNIEAMEGIDTITQSHTQVVRRIKNSQEDNIPMRRISYLRATKNEKANFQMDSNNAISELQNMKQFNEFQCIENHTLEIESETDLQYCKPNKYAWSPKEAMQRCKFINGENNVKSMTGYETEMEMKSSSMHGKRMAEYRSWRHVKVELRGYLIKIYLIRNSKSDNNVINIDVKNFNIMDESVDKKKFIFRLQSKPLFCYKDDKKEQDQAILITNNNSEGSTRSETKNYTEILFKTKSFYDMQKLFDLFPAPKRKINENTYTKELLESSNRSTYEDEYVHTLKFQTIKEHFPSTISKSSNIDNAPLDSEVAAESILSATKLQKPYTKILSNKELSLPKSKNWKHLLFRRINSSGTSDISNSTSTTNVISKYVGSIGVPLKLCPMSKENIFVPLIVDLCTKIVERKGLQIIGIYRIPGNKAAISELRDQVNKSDFQWDSINTDIRWEDVNVVSSLLKLFIRSLPDALLPGTSYINFIEADKKCNDRRLKELCFLLKTLPQHSYETMKYIIRHLNKVSKNCKVNLMEPKNLAIIFGPSIIRIPNETLDMAVKDMKHQCRIVELLVSQYEYFFENGELPETYFQQNIITSSCSDQTSVLLDNVSKIEQRLYDKESLTSRFIPHLRRRSHNKRIAIGSDTYSEESVLSLEYRKFLDVPIKDNYSNKFSSMGNKKVERSSVEISVLTDEDSSNGRLSDVCSMSLTTITDALDNKLRTLRSGSESTDASEKCPNKTHKNFPQSLVLQENIPFADEATGRIETTVNNTITSASKEVNGTPLKKLQIPARSINVIRDIQKQIPIKNSQCISSVYKSCSDDSEVSTTSDPKETIVMTPFFLKRYKKRRDYRLFRSASFNCRNYSSRNYGGGPINNATNTLTKDEKTDMNLTKKRQIQNKQNRSIKRRHTVGGANDYLTTTTLKKLSSNANHILEVGVRKKNVKEKTI